MARVKTKLTSYTAGIAKRNAKRGRNSRGVKKFKVTAVINERKEHSNEQTPVLETTVAPVAVEEAAVRDLIHR
jgi:hypothetical protein